MVLESLAPSRDDLAALYLVLRSLAAESDGDFEATNADLASRVKALRSGSDLIDKGVSAAIGVFRELGLLDSEGTGAYRRLRLLPAPESRLDLSSSVRYTEGLEEVAEFADFKDDVLDASADALLQRLNRPILPDATAGSGCACV
jgi:single-stranded-DNA-specific exonuclease